VVNIIDRTKQRARLLQRAVQQGDPNALDKLRTLRELKPLSDQALREQVKRRHCLALLARELGLNGWAHLTTLWNEPEASDFGSLLYPASCAGHWNIWSASYPEAQQIRAQHGGYLLPYRQQFVIVDRYFIDDLGLDAEAPEWARIGRDWAQPSDLMARHTLCRAAIEARATQS
jgi:hypothetical protein